MDGPPSMPEPERLFVLVATAGGHEAVARVLEAVGADSPHAFLLAIKASDGPSMLGETLEHRSSLSIVRVEGATRLEAGTVYLPPEGAVLRATKTSVRSEPRERGEPGLTGVLDDVVRTWGRRCTVIVLSGGSAPVQDRVRDLLGVGGVVFCQSPPTAALDEMPVSVIRDVGASGVGSVEEIGTWIRDGLSSEVRDTGDPERDDVPLPPAFWTLLEKLRVAMDLDLYAYRTATLYRRVMQRSRALGCETIEAYVQRALGDPLEIVALAPRLLIGTTDFFRNEALFDSLRDVVVPAVRDQATCSVWCAGCSTGEEAYSVAATMLLELEAAGSSARLRVVATDVRPQAIESATAGLYPLARLQNMPAAMQGRFGERVGDRWRVSDELRDCVRFSVHDVLADPTPQDCDLVLFRNVLIYLRPEIHRRALARMHAALRPGGFLAVGESESTHSLEGAFARYAPDSAVLRRVGLPAD